jgi:GntR family transcriptional regulator
VRDTSTTYQRLRQEIVRSIIEGKYQDGHPLPSSRTLAARTGAHCQTIAKAYRELVGVGVVEKRDGHGMFVAEGGAANMLRIERARIEERARALARDARRLGIDLIDVLQRSG